MDYEEFLATIKEMGGKRLLKETTEYKDIKPVNQLYAESKGQLIGAYSPNPKIGGVIFTKPPSRWSKSGRTFEVIDI